MFDGNPGAFGVYENGSLISPAGLTQRGAIAWLEKKIGEREAWEAFYGKNSAYRIRTALDERDTAILAARQTARDALPTIPLTGDVVIFPGGERLPVSYAWELTTDDDKPTGKYQVQTTSGGSFHFGASGYMSYSGSLFLPIGGESMTLTDETTDVPVWFFHHDFASAHNGVHVSARVRVWTTTAPLPDDYVRERARQAAEAERKAARMAKAAEQ